MVTTKNRLYLIVYLINVLPWLPILFFILMELSLAAAIHNFKWVAPTYMGKKLIKTKMSIN